MGLSGCATLCLHEGMLCDAYALQGSLKHPWTGPAELPIPSWYLPDKGESTASTVSSSKHERRRSKKGGSSIHQPSTRDAPLSPTGHTASANSNGISDAATVMWCYCTALYMYVSYADPSRAQTPPSKYRAVRQGSVSPSLPPVLPPLTLPFVAHPIKALITCPPPFNRHFRLTYWSSISYSARNTTRNRLTAMLSPCQHLVSVIFSLGITRKERV